MSQRGPIRIQHNLLKLIGIPNQASSLSQIQYCYNWVTEGNNNNMIGVQDDTTAFDRKT